MGEGEAFYTGERLPGSEAMRRAGIPVTSIPGPSAVTTAVALSGFPAGGFVFAGFAPRKGGALRKLLAQFSECPVPVVLFESPYRLLKLLEGIEEVFGEREVFVARELTKKFEEVLRGNLSEIIRDMTAKPRKGEMVVIISGKNRKNVLPKRKPS